VIGTDGADFSPTLFTLTTEYLCFSPGLAEVSTNASTASLLGVAYYVKD